MVLKHFHEQVISDVYNNLNLADLAEGIQNLCFINPDEGKSLLNLFLAKEEIPIVNINSSILIGLHKSDRENGLLRIVELSRNLCVRGRKIASIFSLRILCSTPDRSLAPYQ